MSQLKSSLRKHFWFWEGKKLGYLTRDIGHHVQDGLRGKFDSGIYAAIDHIGNIQPEQELAHRILQEYAAFPQVQRTMRERHIRKEDILAEIQRQLKEKQSYGRESLR